MKKLGCLAAISLFSTVYASELDIQKGQWAAELDNINFNFKSGGSTRTFSDDTQSKTGSVDFNYTIRGRYAVSNKLNLRLETSYSSEKDYQQSPGETSKQWEDAKTDSSLSPAVELFVSDDLALLGGISLSADSNGEAKGFRFKYFGGVLFTKDITPTLLFASENVVIHDNDLNAPSGWNDTTSGISYLRFGTVNQAKYFIANNFSVNLGLNLSGGFRTSNTIDGKVQENDTKWSYKSLDTTIGFTYYHR